MASPIYIITRHVKGPNGNAIKPIGNYTGYYVNLDAAIADRDKLDKLWDNEVHIIEIHAQV